MSEQPNDRQTAAVLAIAKSGPRVIGKTVAVTTAHELVSLGLLVRGKGTHHSGWWSEADLTEHGKALARSLEGKP